MIAFVSSKCSPVIKLGKRKALAVLGASRSDLVAQAIAEEFGAIIKDTDDSDQANNRVLDPSGTYEHISPAMGGQVTPGGYGEVLPVNYNHVAESYSAESLSAGQLDTILESQDL